MSTLDITLPGATLRVNFDYQPCTPASAFDPGDDPELEIHYIHFAADPDRRCLLGLLSDDMRQHIYEHIHKTCAQQHQEHRHASHHRPRAAA